MPRRRKDQERTETRAIQLVELDVDAQARLDRFVATQGMTQVSVLSNLVEWLASLPPHLQVAILTADDKGAAAQHYLNWLKERKH